MKIEETDIRPAQVGGANWCEHSRVRTVKDGETIPEGATTVPDETPETEWTPVKELK